MQTLRASWFGFEKAWTWYRRNWRATAVSSFLTPVLFLVALGLGFGSQVQSTALIGGVSYLEYLAPALVVVTAIQGATFDSTYPIMSQFMWQKSFVAMAATPITPAQVLYGQTMWIGSQLFARSAVFVAIAVVLGAAAGPGILLSIVFGTLAGLAFSAPLVAYSATLDKPDSFTTIFRFVLMPMTLFTGAFFPVSQLPDWLLPVVWLTPAWHGIELARGATFGTIDLLPALGHLVYLVALTAAGIALGVKFFHRRLAV
ncbi:lipooligosaccharide transport system permease protein [Lentzea albidocapillata subsp. violacea]|uniref:Transport permease protein n=1 Tax=Lentzea albidocapillata subsp. violacea TaxID=128104 RepID=A0A1G9NXZ4_9PSEU|nr:ABC transporter permease [Lentzea albidocapillata]SDL91269.1 lipooligosaccharide transport system permease protein [Lentzea albidocapillata subsp. violacea]